VAECAINGLHTFGFGRGNEGVTPGSEGEEDEVEWHSIPSRGGDRRAWRHAGVRSRGGGGGSCSGKKKAKAAFDSLHFLKRET
jgi:hypothetical protein